MSDICGDNRFELIKKYKQMLIENTNIEMAKDEMAVIDNILFRFWQMNWLDKLEQLPPAQPEEHTEKHTETHGVCLDAIDRQAAMDAVMEFMPSLTTPDGSGQFDREIFEAQEMFVDIGQALNELPSAQPERQKGKWIYGESEAGNDGYYCSKCGHFVPWKYDEYDIDFIKEFLFCNKCGADMRGEQDE